MSKKRKLESARSFAAAGQILEQRGMKLPKDGPGSELFYARVKSLAPVAAALAAGVVVGLVLLWSLPHGKPVRAGLLLDDYYSPPVVTLKPAPLPPAAPRAVPLGKSSPPVKRVSERAI